ncbi:UNVERIFIED_CONTAM: hypothetical protein K2H54_020637 [Gekko kuhli]
MWGGRPLRVGMSGASAPLGVGNRAEQVLLGQAVLHGSHFALSLSHQWQRRNVRSFGYQVVVCGQPPWQDGWAGLGDHVYIGGWLGVAPSPALPGPALHSARACHARTPPLPAPPSPSDPGHSLESSIFVQCYSRKVVGRPSVDNIAPRLRSPSPITAKLIWERAAFPAPPPKLVYFFTSQCSAEKERKAIL